jgi:hypothetical protein
MARSGRQSDGDKSRRRWPRVLFWKLLALHLGGLPHLASPGREVSLDGGLMSERQVGREGEDLEPRPTAEKSKAPAFALLKEQSLCSRPVA